MSWYDRLDIDPNWGFEERPDWDKLFEGYSDDQWGAKKLAQYEINRPINEFSSGIARDQYANKIDASLTKIDLNFKRSYDNMNQNALTASGGGFAGSGASDKAEDAFLKNFAIDQAKEVSDIESGLLDYQQDVLKERQKKVGEEWDIFGKFLQSDPTEYEEPPQGFEDPYPECVQMGNDAEECLEAQETWDDWTGDPDLPGDPTDPFGFDEDEIVDIADEISDLDEELGGDGTLWGYGSWCCPYGEYSFWDPCCHFG